MLWEITFLERLRWWFGSPFFDALMPAVSALADGGVCWILLAAFLLARKGTRGAGLLVAAALVVDAAVVNGVLKPVIARPRPELSGVLPLVPLPADFSFPSGHTAASFAAAAALFFAKSRLASPALYLAALIAFSRLYLGVHFPTDVAAGALIGMGAAYAARRALIKVNREK